MPFQANRTYTRVEIQAEVGGSYQPCLVRARGQVVAVCFRPEMNPRGPEEIYVGMGHDKERAAAALATQTDAVPVFRKENNNKWRYLGDFFGAGYSEEGNDIAKANRLTGRDHIAGVLSMRAAR